MRKLNMIVLIALIICHSCGYKAPLINTSQFYVNIEDQYCYKREYVFSNEYIGPIGKAERLPLSACSGVIGFMPKEWARVYSVIWEQYNKKIPGEDKVLKMRRDLDYVKVVD